MKLARMVVEKLEYGLDMSTRKPDSLTTVQLPDTSTKMSDTTEVQLNNSESQLSTRPVVPDVIDVVNSSPAADSAFTFPVPGDLEAPKHDLIRCDGLIKPATDQPDVISWLPSSSEDTSDFASSSSAVDSGWASRCSPVSSDYQHLETPSPQPSTPSSVMSVSPAHGPVTPSSNQRRSISQLMKGIFSKSPNKVNLKKIGFHPLIEIRCSRGNGFSLGFYFMLSACCLFSCRKWEASLQDFVRRAQKH